MGVALNLGVRAARQGPFAGADQAPGPHSHSSASAFLDDRVPEAAAKWLQAAFDGCSPFANLHLAHLTFYADQEDGALAHLKKHLSWRVRRVLADAGRGHADAHVQRLPCREVLQRRSPKDGFEESRSGRESVDGATQGYLRSALQVARGCQRRCGA